MDVSYIFSRSSLDLRRTLRVPFRSDDDTSLERFTGQRGGVTLFERPKLRFRTSERNSFAANCFSLAVFQEAFFSGHLSRIACCFGESLKCLNWDGRCISLR
jgi:hypothetical protein